MAPAILYFLVRDLFRKDSQEWSRSKLEILHPEALENWSNHRGAVPAIQMFKAKCEIPELVCLHPCRIFNRQVD